MKRMIPIIIFGLGWGIFWILNPSRVYSYSVPPLPEDNLIVNPWFRSASEPTSPGLDGWVAVLQDGIGWGLSQKATNPTADVIVSGRCGLDEDYCGTAARWARLLDEGDKVSYPDLDVYLYQVVKAEAANRKLKYFTYWVNHKIDVAEVRVYGGDTPDGEWTEVWFPFSVSQDRNPPLANAPGRGGNPWFQTDFLETTLENGYPYYKIEFHARYPQPNANQGNVGVKVTGIYFATEFTDAPAAFSTPVIIVNPEIVDGTTVSSTDEPDRASTPSVDEGTPQRVRTPSATAPVEESPIAEPTSTHPGSPTPSASSSQNEESGLDIPSGVAEGTGLGTGFILGLVSAGLFILAFFVIRAVVKKGQG